MKNPRWIIVTLAAVALLTVLLLSAPFAFAEDGRVCGVCGGSISGSYFETGGRIYHPKCFSCDYCKEPIKGPFTVFRGMRYHEPCFEGHVALRCAVCGGVIEGQYFSATSANVSSWERSAME